MLAAQSVWDGCLHRLAGLCCAGFSTDSTRCLRDTECQWVGFSGGRALRACATFHKEDLLTHEHPRYPLYASGAFAIVLGLLHFTFPNRFGFLAALPRDGAPVPPFRLSFYRYEMKRSDLRGIIYVMNHCVSYAIVAAGVFDLFSSRWLGTFPGSLAAGAIAGFWFVRAGTQFYLDHRRGGLVRGHLICALGGVACDRRNSVSEDVWMEGRRSIRIGRANRRCALRLGAVREGLERPTVSCRRRLRASGVISRILCSAFRAPP